MYGKNKTLNAPSDLHAKDKFVYKLFVSRNKPAVFCLID